MIRWAIQAFHSRVVLDQGNYGSYAMRAMWLGFAAAIVIALAAAGVFTLTAAGSAQLNTSQSQAPLTDAAVES